MNQLAFSTVVPADERAAGDLLTIIAAAGFDGVEPTFVPEGGLPSHADPAGEGERLRGLAEKAGLSIPSMRGGPAFWPTFGSPDAAQRQRAVDVAAAGLDAVAAMGGDTLLIVPGRWEGDQTYCRMWDHALDTARRIAELAEQRGMTVALENVENRFLLSPREWRAFLDAVGSERVRMYFDVGNTWRMGRGWPEQWLGELGREYIHRIHFKDAHEFAPVSYLLEGGVNWPAVAEAIRTIGYDDWVGIELDLPAQCPGTMLKATRLTAAEILQAD